MSPILTVAECADLIRRTYLAHGFDHVEVERDDRVSLLVRPHCSFAEDGKPYIELAGKLPRGAIVFFQWDRYG